MLHPHTELRLVDPHIGMGVFATRLIPAGTLTWTLDPLDQRIPLDKVSRLSTSLQRVIEHYAYLDSNGDYILCWDSARFLNHSCAPNTLGPGIAVEIAIRDILPGEQLTGDYGAYNIEHDLPCRCGADRCRGTIRNDDFDLFSNDWDDVLRSAVRRVASVEQPLWEHVSEAKTLLAAAADPLQLPTCAGNRYRGAPSQTLSP